MKTRWRLAVMAAAVVGSLVPVAAPPAAAYPAEEVIVEGRGFGHGRGMGQWGALGYALDHGWTFRRILDHFYGGTSHETLPTRNVRVRMTRFDEEPLLVQQERGHMSTDAAPGTFSALRAELVGPNTFTLQSGPNCGGPWTVVDASVTGPIRFTPTIGADPREEALQLCEPDGTRRWIRGAIETLDHDGEQRTVNDVNVEDYLRGVIPRESPASWGYLAGGAGMHQLRAQAVAARSFALAEGRYAYAGTCDTATCQVYGGIALQRSGFVQLEHPRTDAAVSETAGQVRTKGGGPARAEFSASTGGHTAGGAFPAVPDLGDAVCRSDVCNPHRTWRKEVGVDHIEEHWPSIGRLEDLRVTARNGIGAYGGRAKTVELRGSEGTVLVDSNSFRAQLGMKSDWFTIVAPTGYWVASSGGDVIGFGRAPRHGSMGGRDLARPIVGLAAHASRDGYWLVASDGGVFSFGAARFHGSMGGKRLASPVVGMAAHPSGRGYWSVAADGGIFSFGAAPFKGSMGGKRLAAPIEAMAPNARGDGYWMVALDGGVFGFGAARFAGSVPGSGADPDGDIVDIAAALG